MVTGDRIFGSCKIVYVIRRPRKSNCCSTADDQATIDRLINIKDFENIGVSKINVTAPCRPIPVSDDHVSSANGTRKNCFPDHRLKCNFAIIHVHVHALNQRYDTNMDQSY